MLTIALLVAGAMCLVLTAVAPGLTQQALAQQPLAQQPLRSLPIAPPDSAPQLRPVQPDLSPEQPATEPAPPAEFRPGFLDTLGRWIGNSSSALDSQLKRTQEALGTFGSDAGGAAGAAQEAAGAVVALPASRIVNGRQTCDVAQNGAPDCQPAVNALCQTKGFQAGRSLEVSSARNCPARVWLQGTAAEKAQCRVETYVTRALCQ